MPEHLKSSFCLKMTVTVFQHESFKAMTIRNIKGAPHYASIECLNLKDGKIQVRLNYPLGATVYHSQVLRACNNLKARIIYPNLWQPEFSKEEEEEPTRISEGTPCNALNLENFEEEPN